MENAERKDEFGRLLQEFRLRVGMTQEVLAERAGLGRRSVQALEGGESGPQRGTVQRLVEVLGLSPPELARFEAAAQPSPRRRQPTENHQSIRILPDGHADSAPRHNLPALLTSFIGRDGEIREVGLLLTTKRLVTLTGTGGCGKTRLAQQVAAKVLASYPDGAWLVELAPLTDPALIPRTIANTLGLFERPDRPVLSALAGFLQSCHCLLVLDNCEHLIGTCAQVATSLLHACPQLTILATSRQPLQVFGEVQWHVPSLPTPDPTSQEGSPGNLADVVSAYPAIQLFAERAQAVQPTFALDSENLRGVVQICWRLDGLPLAIELAAARVRGLSVESIADRLDRRFQLLTAGSRGALPRQQTLRATIDWSYGLLSEVERVLFRRLSAFAGSFTVEAVEGICAGEGLIVGDILPALLQLVGQSLVEVESPEGAIRYRLLETIREYSRERLAEAGEVETMRRQHCAWYLTWVKESGPWARGANRKTWRNRFEREHDNLRAALQFYRENDVGSGLRLASYLHEFWKDRSHIAEGQRWLEDLLEKATPDTSARGVALVALGRLRQAQNDMYGAIALLEEGLAVLRPDGPSRDLAYALQFLGSARLGAGDDVGAQPLLEECVEVARVTGDLDLEGQSIGFLGNLAFLQGDKPEARERYAKSLSLSREAGAFGAVDWMLRIMAALDLSEGRTNEARALLHESLALAWEIGHGTGVVGSLTNFGILAQHEGDCPRAVRLFAAVSRDSLPVVSPRLEGTDREAGLAACRSALGEEAFAQAWVEGQAMSLEQAVRYALSDNLE